MRFDLEQAIAVLTATPAILQAWLGQLPPEWVLARDGDESWSPFDVVGHLSHSDETNWLPRARLILSDSPSRQFEPFDRFAMLTRNEGREIHALLDDFAALRADAIAQLRALGLREADYERTATHPQLGTVTLRQLLASWVAHDLNHLGQIAEVMARHYKEEVGPWQSFLAILDR